MLLSSVVQEVERITVHNLDNNALQKLATSRHGEQAKH
jgi:hypothetical protein